MSRYYGFYNHLATFSMISESDYGLHEAILTASARDPFFMLIFFIFSNLGLSFQSFLLLIIFLFNYSFSRIAIAIGYTNYLSFFIFLSLSSFWMTYFINVVLRQGLALLPFIFFLYFFSNKKFLKGSINLSISYLIHGMSILAIPFLFLRSLFLKNIYFLHIPFIITYILYISGVLVLTSDLIVTVTNIIGIDLRAMNSESGYVVGPTLMKSIAIITPFFVIFATGVGTMHPLIREFYIFYIYIEIIGMFLSGFPYHDRIMLIGWVLSPFLIGHGFLFYFSRHKKPF